MPRPRFRKLAAAKQDQIFEAAAREFATNGYEKASMNKILEAAQLSKGAAYYYFDDKADLFAATVEHYAGDLIGDLGSTAEDLTAETFWSTFADMYGAQFDFFYDKPWAFGALKAAGRLSMEELASNPVLRETLGEVHMAVKTLLRRGQTIGVVRRDLPEDLLAAIFIGIDDATDRWLLQHWGSMDRTQLIDTVQRVMVGMSRMLAPQAGETND